MTLFRRFSRSSAAVLAIFGAVMILSSCQLAKNQLQTDRAAELDRQEYRDALAPVQLPEETAENIPDFQPVLSTPQELRLPSPLVTVSVNQTVSLRDLLFELSEQADIDLELDPQIRGSIIFTAKERPFDQVVDRICEMSGLRYKFENNVLRVELDRPYIKNYNIDYMSVERTGESEVEAEIKLGSGGGGGGAAGGTPKSSGGSSASIETKVEGDLWKELEENIEQILTSSDTHISLATLADPVAMAVNPLPPPMPVDPNAAATTPPPLPGSAQVAPMPAAAAPTLNISTPAAEPLVPNPPATFSISKQSGMLSVFASERQQKQIAKFLDEFRRRSTTQVLIEAKVLQVELTDEYATGIDWDSTNLTGLLRFSATFPSPGVPDAGGTFQAVLSPGNDVSALIEALSRFGTVRALSSPRVTVLNNQPALVNVAQNNIYFTYDVETSEDSDTNKTSVKIDSEQQSTPEGVIMTVVPTANPDTGEILLSVRPTVSKITGTVTDPTITFALASIGIDPLTPGIPVNSVPEVSVQEIDSTLRIQSGQVIVMGGLMKDSNRTEQESIPIAGDLPFIGSLFRSHSDTIEKSELVIFIKARIVPGSNVEDMDRKIYNTFSLDRRPDRM